MKEYLEEIFFPYIDAARVNSGLSDDYPALAIFDNFKGQVTDDVMQLLEDHNVHVVKLPANCTDRLQPMDISVNKAAKDFLRQRFNEWYSEKVADQLGDGDIDQLQVQPVNFTGAAMKAVGARWLVQMYEYIRDNPQLIVNGFIKAGISQAIDAFSADELGPNASPDEDSQGSVTDSVDR